MTRKTRTSDPTLSLPQTHRVVRDGPLLHPKPQTVDQISPISPNVLGAQGAGGKAKEKGPVERETDLLTGMIPRIVIGTETEIGMIPETEIGIVIGAGIGMMTGIVTGTGTEVGLPRGPTGIIPEMIGMGVQIVLNPGRGRFITSILLMKTILSLDLVDGGKEKAMEMGKEKEKEKAMEGVVDTRIITKTPARIMTIGEVITKGQESKTMMEKALRSLPRPPCRGARDALGVGRTPLAV